MKMVIANVTAFAPAIKLLSLRAADGGGLPAGAPGAHVLLEIPGPERIWKNAYSLVSSPENRDSCEIIVRRVEHSRGGSAWLHDHAAMGQVMEVGTPTNLFPIARLARRHLLVSAGIGATPFLAYAPVLRAEGRAFEWHHCCRAAELEAFAAMLPKDAVLHGRRDGLKLEELLRQQRLDTHLYVCGPSMFMDAVLDTARRLGWPDAKLHFESFGGATGGAPFTARLARSCVTLHVEADKSLLETIEAAGLNPPSLCRGGACGECELPVLAGIPEHRDHVLTASAHAANHRIMTCVSRAKTPELVLDF